MLLKFNTTVKRYSQNLITQNESIAGNIPLNNYLCNILVIYDNLSLLFLEKKEQEIKEQNLLYIALDLVVLLNWCSPILLQYHLPRKGERRTSIGQIKEKVFVVLNCTRNWGKKTVTYL